MNNTSDGLLNVPGFNDTPLRFELPSEERFAHGAMDWWAYPRMTARELAMLHLMNTVTDEFEWHVRIFDHDEVAKWRDAALRTPLISLRTWEWCLAELRDKAKYYAETGLVLTLDTSSSVCKADHLVSSELQDGMRQGVESLLEQAQNEQKPCDEATRRSPDLIDPFMFPLVYDRSLVKRKKDAPGLQSSFLGSYGSCETAPSHTQQSSESHEHDAEVERPDSREGRWAEMKTHRWSDRFQCLPCDVQYTRPTTADVQIASYINNLHPIQNQQLYTTIEGIIQQVIEPWNQVLIKGTLGRRPLRIRTYGVEWGPDLPEWAMSLKGAVVDPNDKGCRDTYQKVKNYLALPNSRCSYDPDEPEMEIPDLNSLTDFDEALDMMGHKRYYHLYHFLHPDPGAAYTYEEWKKGKTAKAVVDKSENAFSGQDQDHTSYTVKLQETFREQGLQVIVKLTNFELTPDKPSYAGGEWHVDGALNEHIVATSVYYFDDDNVVEGQISFRQPTTLNEQDYVYDPYEHEPLEAVLGVEDKLDDSIQIQQLGAVSTKQGRLLTWPNVLQNRVEPFELRDKTRPGHRRYLTLSLVDPHYRICSTSNVPPQRHDWWADTAYARMGFGFRKIPQEVVEMIDKETQQWPIGMEEAKQLRSEMLWDRALINENVAKGVGHARFRDN